MPSATRPKPHIGVATCLKSGASSWGPGRHFAIRQTCQTSFRSLGRVPLNRTFSSMAKRMPRHDNPDWAALIACIESQEGLQRTAAEDFTEVSSVPLSAQSAYVRVERFLRRICPGWALDERSWLRDATLEIAKEFNLSQRATARLAIALANIAIVHATEKHWEAQPSLPTVSRALERIEKSV